MFGAAAGSAAEGEVAPGDLSSDTGLSLIKLHVPGSSELCSSLTVLGQEQDLADLGVAEIAPGTLKGVIVVYVFEIFKHASVPHALGLACCCC